MSMRAFTVLNESTTGADASVEMLKLKLLIHSLVMMNINLLHANSKSG